MLKLNNTILDGREIRVSEQIIKDREDPRDGYRDRDRDRDRGRGYYSPPPYDRRRPSPDPYMRREHDDYARRRTSPPRRDFPMDRRYDHLTLRGRSPPPEFYDR